MLVDGLMGAQQQDLDAETTHSFPTEGREEYADEMKGYGYMELEGYVVSPKAYCCGNCASMVEYTSSPTGYWCRKFQFPDRPWGCCDGFSPLEAAK